MKTLNNLSRRRELRAIGFFSLFMIFSMFINPLFAQSGERVVSGIINTTDGPLLGAAIILKGTSTGVVSNENGEFTFPQELTENDVLVVSYLGYETHEIIIESDTTFVHPFLEDIAIVVVAAMRAGILETSTTKRIN